MQEVNIAACYATQQQKARKKRTMTVAAFIVGSTGLCGNAILKNAHGYFDKVYSLSRSTPKHSDGTNNVILTEKDSSQWVSKVSELSGGDEYDTFFSGLGTTRDAAGGLENQYKIDHDLNLELARAAKAKGFKRYVLISSGGASAGSMFPYLKMKGELEDHVLELGFEQTIVLRPGLLLGEREGANKKWLNTVGSKLVSWSYGTRFSGITGHPIYGEDVALAALKASKKNYNDKVVIISGDDILHLARE